MCIYSCSCCEESLGERLVAEGHVPKLFEGCPVCMLCDRRIKEQRCRLLQTPRAHRRWNAATAWQVPACARRSNSIAAEMVLKMVSGTRHSVRKPAECRAECPWKCSTCKPLHTPVSHNIVCGISMSIRHSSLHASSRATTANRHTIAATIERDVAASQNAIHPTHDTAVNTSKNWMYTAIHRTRPVPRPL